MPFGPRLYYMVQRTAGNLRRPDFSKRLKLQAEMLRRLQKYNISVADKRLMEVGTGWIPMVPFGFWLAGASVVTVDLHRYLSPNLTKQAIQWMVQNGEKLKELYRGAIAETQIDERLAFMAKYQHSAIDFMAAAGIEYIAPGDAAKTSLPDDSIDLHYSVNTFEHIPGPVLKAILTEARRVIRPDGYAFHHVDPSDHFSHSDRSITGINFLQYTPEEFAEFNDNQFAYHNRLRDGHYREIYDQTGWKLHEFDCVVDQRSLEALHSGFKPHSDFAKFPPEEICRLTLDYIHTPV